MYRRIYILRIAISIIDYIIKYLPEHREAYENLTNLYYFSVHFLFMFDSR